MNIIKKVFILAYLVPSYGFKKFEERITTLDRWQKASNVLVVQLEELLSFPINPEQSFTKESKWVFAKLKVKDIWSQKESLSKDYFYSSYPSYRKKDIGKIFIGAYGLITTTNSYPGRYINHKLNSTDNMYLTLWYHLANWPVFKNEAGQWYVSGCIDGLTKEPLIDPLLEKVKQLAIPRIDKKSTTKLLGFLWPDSEVTSWRVKTCKKKRD